MSFSLLAEWGWSGALAQTGILGAGLGVSACRA